MPSQMCCHQREGVAKRILIATGGMSYGYNRSDIDDRSDSGIVFYYCMVAVPANSNPKSSRSSKNLRIANASLESHKESMQQIQSVLRLILSIDNLKKGGKDQIIMIEPTIPPAERQRLIQYLRSEGFIW